MLSTHVQMVVFVPLILQQHTHVRALMDTLERVVQVKIPIIKYTIYMHINNLYSIIIHCFHSKLGCKMNY